jgi:hypothetical protein
MTASFLYRLSPRLLILIAGSLPLLPHLFIVRGDTRRILATSLTVNKSGQSSPIPMGTSFEPSFVPRLCSGLRAGKAEVCKLMC